MTFQQPPPRQSVEEINDALDVLIDVENDARSEQERILMRVAWHEGYQAAVDESYKGWKQS
jgi:hypothetical protein